MMRIGVALCFASALIAADAPASSQVAAPADLTERIVNDPRPEAFRPYGLRVAPGVRRDAAVQFGKALRIPIDRAQAEDWRIGVTVPVLKPIKAGDRIVIAFWGRAHRTEAGAPGKIARVQLEIAAPPHRALFAKPVEVGPEWKMHQVAGVADRDYAPQELNAAMHLASAKQVIDVGPLFVLRYAK